MTSAFFRPAYTMRNTKNAYVFFVLHLMMGVGERSITKWLHYANVRSYRLKSPWMNSWPYSAVIRDRLRFHRPKDLTLFFPKKSLKC